MSIALLLVTGKRALLFPTKASGHEALGPTLFPSARPSTFKMPLNQLTPSLLPCPHTPPLETNKNGDIWVRVHPVFPCNSEGHLLANYLHAFKYKCMLICMNIQKTLQNNYTESTRWLLLNTPEPWNGTKKYLTKGTGDIS